MNITILGAGAFGTALSICLSKLKHNINLVTYTEDFLQELKTHHENLTFFKGFKIPEHIKFDINIPKNTDVLLLATPAQKIPQVITRLKTELNPNIPIIFCSKGIYIEEENHSKKYFLMSEYAKQHLENPLLALSGPNFAHEIACFKHSGTTLSSEKFELAKELSKTLSLPHFKIKPWHDLLGTQACGAMKNVFAIATGIFEGMKFGLNAQAALWTQSIDEIRTLSQHLWKVDIETFSGLAGIGDLILTCSSHKSRNFQLGLAIASGIKWEEYQKTSKAVAEGAYTTQSIHKIKNNLNLPVCDFVYSSLYTDTDIRILCEDLFKNPHYLS